MAITKTERLKLEREERKLWKEINKAFEGGTSFGIDWPTLRAVMPDEAQRLAEIRQKLRS